jgi:hypothetical protein
MLGRQRVGRKCLPSRLKAREGLKHVRIDEPIEEPMVAVRGEWDQTAPDRLLLRVTFRAIPSRPLAIAGEVRQITYGCSRAHVEVDLKGRRVKACLQRDWEAKVSSKEMKALGVERNLSARTEASVEGEFTEHVCLAEVQDTCVRWNYVWPDRALLRDHLDGTHCPWAQVDSSSSDQPPLLQARPLNRRIYVDGHRAGLLFKIAAMAKQFVAGAPVPSLSAHESSVPEPLPARNPVPTGVYKP